ncbi:MAG: hypothetical protein R3Y54_13585 [Eubacteriales bacterium]
MIFIEGTWCFSENEFIYECRWGAAKMAKDNNKPIVPQMIEYLTEKCYLNEGSKMYFYDENSEKNSYENKLEKERTLIEVVKGTRVVICKNGVGDVLEYISNNDDVKTYQSFLEHYKMLVNNTSKLQVTYLYKDITNSQVMNVLRDSIATMKWYLYEDFGIYKNNLALKEEFENSIYQIKTEYPVLDYEEEEKVVFKSYEKYDDIFKPLESMVPNNKVGISIMIDLIRKRKEMTRQYK